MDVVGRKVVKTRAAHVCFGCGRKFEYGFGELRERALEIESAKMDGGECE